MIKVGRIQMKIEGEDNYQIIEDADEDAAKDVDEAADDAAEKSMPRRERVGYTFLQQACVTLGGRLRDSGSSWVVDTESEAGALF